MAFGIDDAVTSVSTLLNTAIDKIWPNPEDKAKAEALVMTAAADSAVKQLQAAQAVMLAEAQSTDKWTSRARPSFLYVVYVLILASLPMGLLFMVNPTAVHQIITGFHEWLSAIPDKFVDLFMYVMLGYTGARSFEKVKGAAK